MTNLKHLDANEIYSYAEVGTSQYNYKCKSGYKFNVVNQTTLSDSIVTTCSIHENGRPGWDDIGCCKLQFFVFDINVIMFINDQLVILI